MTIRFAASVAFVALIPAFGVANAEDVFRPSGPPGAIISCHFGDGGAACSRFQGYIYVHHRDGAQAAPSAADSANSVLQNSDATLGATRLYLNVGSQSEP